MLSRLGVQGGFKGAFVDGDGREGVRLGGKGGGEKTQGSKFRTGVERAQTGAMLQATPSTARIHVRNLHICPCCPYKIVNFAAKTTMKRN
jgi:hypothetical protein